MQQSAAGDLRSAKAWQGVCPDILLRLVLVMADKFVVVPIVHISVKLNL